jgi:hypothetical protein
MYVHRTHHIRRSVYILTHLGLGVSRSSCRRVVDMDWRLCGQPFFLPVSFFAFTVWLSTCDVFLFFISVVCRVVVAVALAVSCCLHPDVLQHCLTGLLTICRSCSLWETIPVLHCPFAIKLSVSMLFISRLAFHLCYVGSLISFLYSVQIIVFLAF